MPGFTSKSFNIETPPPRDIDETRPETVEVELSEDDQREKDKAKYRLAIVEGTPLDAPFGVLTEDERRQVQDEVFGPVYAKKQRGESDF